MKSLLKLFGAIALTSTPLVTVVACGGQDTDINTQDIQNAALALMRDSQFNMTDLGINTTADLMNLRIKKFKDFSAEIQEKISTIMGNELKKSTNEHPTQWYYDDALVVLNNGTTTTDDDNFQIPTYVDGKHPEFEGIISGYLYVNVSVTYKNLPPISKNIRLTFNNDTTTKAPQTGAMADFIKYKIDNDLFKPVDVATLPNSDSTTDIKTASTNLNNSIVPHLRVKIKDLIQYPKDDLNVNIAPYYDATTPVSTSFFTIKTPTATSGKLQFSGTLQNIIISFNIGDASSSFKIADNKITVNQNQTDAVNQVSGAFHDQSQYANALPATVTPNLKTVIINDAVTNITQSYSDIIANDITITNEKEANFNATDDKTGYFILNFKVTHIYNSIDFTVEVQHIKITVSIKTQP